MNLPLGRRIKAAFDGFRDPVTGRGSRFDRTRRLQGGDSSYADSELLDLYNSNGFMQRIVNAPSDDSTREWFEIETKDPEDARLMQERFKELNFKPLLRDLVKYSSIYPKGAGIFMGVFAANVRDQRAMAEPMPSTILKIDFLNLMSDPGDFSISIGTQRDATKRDFNEVTFRIGSQDVHKSWVLWLVNEFNPRKAKGISKVDTVFDSVSAQDSALWSVSTLMQALSILTFRSDEFIGMKPAEQTDFLKRVRSWVDSQSMMGLGKDETLERLNSQFPGVKDLLDFIFQNMSGSSQIPVNILLGRAQGVLTAAEEDTINYYNGISRGQEVKLTPIVKQLGDVIVLERRGALFAKTGGKIDYGIKWNPLWELSPSLKAELELKNAQRDSLDILDAKARPEEARQLDPRYEMLDLEEMPDDEDDDDDDENTPPTRREGDTDEMASLTVDGKSIPAALIALDRTNMGGKFHRIQVQAPRLFVKGTFRVRVLDGAHGIYAIDGRPRGAQLVTIQAVVFEKDHTTHDKAKQYVDLNITSRPGFEELKFEADKKIIVSKRDDEITVEMHTWDEMVQERPDWPKLISIDHEKGISGWRGKLLRNGKLVWKSIIFKDKAWTPESAETWVDLNLPNPAAFDSVEADRGVHVNKHDGSITVHLVDSDKIDTASFKHVDLDLDKKIVGWIGKLKESGKPVFQWVTFNGEAWTPEMAETWVDLNLPNPADFDDN